MAMSEILSKAKELGKSVYVSVYELTHDNVYDLLNPTHPAFQVYVKSISKFHSTYFSRGSSQNTQEVSTDQPHNHKGLMVHISDELKPNLVNKINFVDLAGYEDPRKSSKNGITAVESNRINKSLYALLSVVSAINANEIRVPYRENTSAQESKILPNLALVVPPFSLEEETLLPSAFDDDNVTIPTKKDDSSHSGIYHPEASPDTHSVPNALVHFEAASTCEEDNTLYKRDDASPPLSERIREISYNLRSLSTSTSLRIEMPNEVVAPGGSSQEKNDVSYYAFIQGIGEKKATYILELREESPEPFKDV
ncbi:hypothetical protein BUALT_Bualt18G0126400 [Buddleja alternifolia]|uniref:Kinesin motor domain-containing protein n=1 Tax=Buddleja alternifolia TaxID=168488 RepID=A0AAV6WFE4_9LAMI|nr:hypothetical protein BUALT_Bualt18G0126400 [Buddleja alternifolia]